MKFRQFRLQDPNPDASGSGAAEDRGDSLTYVAPEAKPDPTEAEAQAAADKLAAELAAEAADAADKDDKDGDKKGKKDSRIPLARHEAILKQEREKREALAAELAKYQHGSELANVNEQITTAENSIMKMEKEYAQLLTDGEIDKATALMATIRKTERDMAEAKSDMKIQAAEARNTERARYNISLERIESAFPTLNEDHADFDAELMAEVVDLKDAYQMKGMTPTQALQKAVKMLVEPRTTKQEVATTSQPRVGEKDLAAERKAAAVSKTADAVTKQPPTLDKVGKDGDKLGGGAIDPSQIMGMSQAEFAKLNEADLARMRGDTV